LLVANSAGARKYWVENVVLSNWLEIVVELLTACLILVNSGTVLQLLEDESIKNQHNNMIIFVTARFCLATGKQVKPSIEVVVCFSLISSNNSHRLCIDLLHPYYHVLHQQRSGGTDGGAPEE
jgi:hypothetical protein